MRRTGALLDCDIATVFTLQDGKIARMLAMADMSPIVDAYRAALLDERMPALVPLALFAGIAFAVFVSGHWVFMRSKRTFADLL